MEKVAAEEKAAKKKAAAAERKRLKAEAKKLAEQRAARKAALKATILPLIVARDGVREFFKASYAAALKLTQEGRQAMKQAAGSCLAAGQALAKAGRGGVNSTTIAARNAINGSIRIALAFIRRLDPRPAVQYIGEFTSRATLALFSLTGRIALGSVTAFKAVLKAIVAWSARLNPLPYFGRGLGSVGKLLVKLLLLGQKLAANIFAATSEQARNFSRHLQPRRLLTYSYAAAIGASLVIVGGQIALKVADDRKDHKATELMASNQAASDAPVETEAATAVLQAKPVTRMAEVQPPAQPARKDILTMDRADRAGITAKNVPGIAKQAPEMLAPEPQEPPVQSAALNPSANTAPVYATAWPVSPTRPVIAVVIDDMGMVQGNLKRFAKLPAEVTYAFLPYAPNLEYQTRVMRESGHELIVHLPMEPKRETADPGPKALLTRLSDAELNNRIAWNLSRFEGFTGINNHMGSRFTEDPRVMRAVMSALKKRDLYFLDSMTTSASVGIPTATEYGVSQAQRDIFLDNERDYGSIMRQLRKAERIAERRGHVIAIGHPYRITYQVLKDWAPTLKRKGIQLVALSALIRRPVPDVRIAEGTDAGDRPANPGRTIASSAAAGLH